MQSYICYEKKDNIESFAVNLDFGDEIQADGYSVTKGNLYKAWYGGELDVATYVDNELLCIVCQELKHKNL